MKNHLLKDTKPYFVSIKPAQFKRKSYAARKIYLTNIGIASNGYLRKKFDENLIFDTTNTNSWSLCSQQPRVVRKNGKYCLV